MNYIITILATAIALLVMILLVSAKPRLSKLVTIWALIIAAGGGTMIYGYGYMDVTGNFPLAILKAALAVCGSFVGADEYSVIPDAPALQTTFMQVICTFIRICALYVTASTVISAIGAGALQRFRLWLSRRGKLNIIYGTNENAPAFAQELLRQKQGSVVFVVQEPGEDYASAITRSGSVLRTDSHSLSADKQFLRSIGIGRKAREITLYAVDEKSSANIAFATALLCSLKEKNADPKDLHLVILAPENSAAAKLQNTENTYGYGYVTAVNVPQLAARLLTLKYPPCNEISFDEEGKATEDFEALIIGFGQVGQGVLKALVINGQFVGSTFRTTVFAPDCITASGSFAARHKELLKQYHISFVEADGRSPALYEHLSHRGEKLKYAAICTGNHKQDREIAQSLNDYFEMNGLDIPVYIVSHSGVECCAQDGSVTEHSIFSTEVLCTSHLDQQAMILNHRYHPESNRTPEENWLSCDYFSRQSCRASADFLPAMIRAAGKAPENWELTEKQLENLSITEHLRWCAFHYSMGFSPMTPEEFQTRCETFLQQKQAGEKPLRIGKNMANRTHACLIPWDALEELSQKEAQVTGCYVNYKKMDTDNVLAIPLLK